MRVTGLTGGMGSGKSRAAAFLCDHFRVRCLSADSLVHELLEPGRSCWQVVHDLDPAFLREDGSIDKPVLRRALFADDGLRERLNREMHPLVRDALMDRIRRAGWDGEGHFLVEVPLLFEAGWLAMFTEIIVVYARRQTCLARIMARDHVSREEAEKSLKSQLPLDDKVLRADHVIDNSRLWWETSLQLLHLGSLLWQKK